ncbi:hypothetical protein DVG78_01995 [Runella aurantiaca]|uniref:Uncharacterized protein n=2 Tax=Runella aurantiaca TaxID=2282308 RepID=A0A369IDV0_9BACT|nr:hypothetical protein DVG78_01995 [Runella aurantiaca]
MPPYVSQDLLTTYQTSITQSLPNPNETLYQLSVSHQYPQSCVVAAYLNITPPFCQTELNLGVSPESSVFANQAKNFAAGQVITSTGNINKGGYSEYEAGKSVELLPGFTAEKGSVFKANLVGCNN